MPRCASLQGVRRGHGGGLLRAGRQATAQGLPGPSGPRRIVIHEGVLASLQRFKDSVKEVVAGYECGLSIEKFNDIKEGDVVEAFTMEQIQV